MDKSACWGCVGSCCASAPTSCVSVPALPTNPLPSLSAITSSSSSLVSAILSTVDHAMMIRRPQSRESCLRLQLESLWDQEIARCVINAHVWVILRVSACRSSRRPTAAQRAGDLYTRQQHHILACWFRCTRSELNFDANGFAASSINQIQQVQQQQKSENQAARNLQCAVGK